MILPTFFASTHPEFRDTIFSRPPNKRGVAVNRQKIYGVTIDTGFQVALSATQLLLPPAVVISAIIIMLLPPNLDFVYKS